MMEARLRQINAVPGVVGSLAYAPDGTVVARAFPAAFAEEALARAATVAAHRTPALDAALGPVGLIDFRYGNARVVLKVTDGVRLLLLCAPSMNLQLLAMSVDGAAARWDAPSAPAAAPPPGPAAGGELFDTAQRVNAAIARSGADAVKLRGQIALKAGFSLDLVDADTPDDAAMLEALRAAASAVLGKTF